MTEKKSGEGKAKGGIARAKSLIKSSVLNEQRKQLLQDGKVRFSGQLIVVTF